jgi:hypothetical protein
MLARNAWGNVAKSLEVCPGYQERFSKPPPSAARPPAFDKQCKTNYSLEGF